MDKLKAKKMAQRVLAAWCDQINFDEWLSTAVPHGEEEPVGEEFDQVSNAFDAVVAGIKAEGEAA